MKGIVRIVLFVLLAVATVMLPLWSFAALYWLGQAVAAGFGLWLAVLAAVLYAGYRAA